jgi:hypothetical protein
MAQVLSSGKAAQWMMSLDQIGHLFGEDRDRSGKRHYLVTSGSYATLLHIHLSRRVAGILRACMMPCGIRSGAS